MCRPMSLPPLIGRRRCPVTEWRGSRLWLRRRTRDRQFVRRRTPRRARSTSTPPSGPTPLRASTSPVPWSADARRHRLADDRLAVDRRSSDAAGTGDLALRDRQLRPAGAGDEPSGRLGGVRGRATRSGRGRPPTCRAMSCSTSATSRTPTESRACWVSRSTRPPTSPTSTTRRRPGTPSSPSSPSIRQPACSIRRRVARSSRSISRTRITTAASWRSGPTNCSTSASATVVPAAIPSATRSISVRGSARSCASIPSPAAISRTPCRPTTRSSTPPAPTRRSGRTDCAIRGASRSMRRRAICGSPMSARATGRR